MENNLSQKFSSDPFEYEISNHYAENSIKDGPRHLDWKKTFDTIRNGELQKASGSADVEWVRDYHGVKCYVLTGWNSEREVAVLVTGWLAVHDPRQAIQSGRWTEKQLREIHQFNGGEGLEVEFDYP